MSLATAAGEMIKDLQRVVENITLCYQATLYDVGATLVFYTPIDTGLASSNWNVDNVGTISIEREPIEGVKGLAALRAISGQVKLMKLGDTAIFSNPVDYIPKLEAGISRQAIGGMIIPTASRVDDIWLTNARKFKLI